MGIGPIMIGFCYWTNRRSLFEKGDKTLVKSQVKLTALI